jgi:hypothetical protein
MTSTGYLLALLLSLSVAYALAVTGYVAVARATAPSQSAGAPDWSQPLRNIHPYSVQKGYGTSRGVTCDLSVYTTNKAALDGNGRLKPGDTTATVCVVRKADAGKPSPVVVDDR